MEYSNFVMNKISAEGKIEVSSEQWNILLLLTYLESQVCLMKTLEDAGKVDLEEQRAKNLQLIKETSCNMKPDQFFQELFTKTEVDL